jgi:hypothetical protein
MSRIGANLRLILERIKLVFAGHRDGKRMQRVLRRKSLAEPYRPNADILLRPSWALHWTAVRDTDPYHPCSP